jgi:hypothetical protein
MALTETQLTDRVRAVLLASPFQFIEANDPNSFDFNTMGQQAQKEIFRVQSEVVETHGQFSMSEEVVTAVHIWVAKAIASDYDACRRSLETTSRMVVKAIVNDGTRVSGEYDVQDAGRRQDIIGEAGASFMTLRMVLPVNYEAVLS